MKAIITITADFPVELPSVPNFISIGENKTFDIKDIDIASLARIADAWKQALLENADRRMKGEE